MNRSFPFLLAIAAYIAFSGCVSIPPSDLAKRQQAVATHGTIAVPGERIGPVTIGMTTADLLAMLGEPDEKKENRFPDGTLWDVTWNYFSINLSVSVKANSTTPWVYQVGASTWFDKRPKLVSYTTSRGIGFGASAFAVKAAYGDPSSEAGGPDYYWGNIAYSTAGLQFGLVRQNLQQDYRVSAIWVTQP
jgi:hypothetical protein